MSHMFGGTSSSDREKLFATDKKCCSVNKFSAHLNLPCQNGPHRMKHLRSRRKRSQVRGGGKVPQSHHHRHHHCRHQTKEGLVHMHNCCQSSCHCLSKHNAPFTNVVPTPQEPSIITGSRLLGHQGLFNHEVKSIDIERLLSGGKQEQEKNVTSQPPVKSPAPSPLPRTDLPGADTGNVSPLGTKAMEKEGKSPGSSLTPGQKPPQQLDISSGSIRSILSSKHSSADVVTIQANDDKSETVRETQLPPTVDPDNMRTLNKNRRTQVASTLEYNPKTREESRVVQTQAHSPSPAQLSSSHTPDISTQKYPDGVLESVGTVAARLFDCVQLPSLSRRNLVAESREVLLRALQERYGSRLKDEICKMQQCLGFRPNTAVDVQDQQQDEFLAPDGSATAFQANAVRQPRFHTPQTTSFDLTRSRRFARKSSPQPRCSSKWPAEQLTSPVETPVRHLDDIFRPAHSPQFSMDFECSRDAACDLFSSSPNAGWGVRAPASQRQEDNRPERKEAIMFGSFENSVMNLTREVSKRRCGSQYSDSHPHPLFPDGAQLPHRLSAEPFETERYTFAQSSTSAAQIAHRQQSSSLQPSSQFSHEPAWPPFRPSHTDMTHYPPTHLLERDQAPLPASSLSPKDWTFHPMRLY